MQLHIRHETRYAYTPSVQTAQHIVHLKPLHSRCQTLHSHQLQVAPEPSERRERMDVFGNTETYLALPLAHDSLSIVADSVVSTSAPAPAHAEHAVMSWEFVREHFRYHTGTLFDSAAEFGFTSPYVPRHDDFNDWGLPSFGTHVPLLQVAQSLMERIHDEFVYQSNATEVGTLALEALHRKRGVCQDFAHVMVACLRAFGLPARYVSGYLLTEPPPGQARLIGADASHAWASVYLPPITSANGDNVPGQWFDFDPTNRRTPGEDYVTLAIGRDYSDVSPIRGVIHGGAQHTMAVAVTVEPVAQATAV